MHSPSSDLADRPEHDHLLEVDLLPVASDDEAASISLSSAALATTLFLSVGPPRGSPSSSDPAVLKDRQRWRDALDSSCRHALRSLSGLTTTTSSSRRRSSSMPRSPSLSARHTAADEHEERGFWAGRLKEVRREMADAPVGGLASPSRSPFAIPSVASSPR